MPAVTVLKVQILRHALQDSNTGLVLLFFGHGFGLERNLALIFKFVIT